MSRFSTLPSLVTVVSVDSVVARLADGVGASAPPKRSTLPLSYGAFSGRRTWEALPRDPPGAGPITSHCFVCGFQNFWRANSASRASSPPGPKFWPDPL